MGNPSLVVRGSLAPLLELTKSLSAVGVPLDMLRLCVSQVNGRVIKIPSDTDLADERLREVRDWRTAGCFTDGERAALALAEAATDLRGPDDPVPDEIWDEAARHWNEAELGALVLQIGLVNLWNRVNVSTNQEPAEWR